MDAQQKIVKWVREHPGATLADALRARPGGMSRSTTEMLFRASVAEGRIVRRKRGGGWEAPAGD